VDAPASLGADSAAAGWSVSVDGAASIAAAAAAGEV